ncbi:MAG: hypothetical protein PHI71_18270, partial [Acidiphilium sp.]|nr:hypothetical protein [Acidiphilium sp.]
MKTEALSCEKEPENFIHLVCNVEPSDQIDTSGNGYPPDRRSISALAARQSASLRSRAWRARAGSARGTAAVEDDDPPPNNHGL